MRVDVVSIFPDYLAPLELSLAGKARAAGLLEVHVHDLRRWTHDRHRTVDDTPAGGGAGMVMKPEPWGEALDEVLGEASTLVVPTPAGVPFDQATARDLATREHLVFACGRYEGIDQRVVDHYAGRVEVHEVSIGDYVLNGGEVAALVVVEAVARLLPGFMGNAESLAEESHEDGLLEYPVYTKPATWRDIDVPRVLLSGDHGAIAAWRHEQALRRTAQRRPDLAHPARLIGHGDLDLTVAPGTPADDGELTTLVHACLPAGHRPSVDPVGCVIVRAGGRLVAASPLALDGAAWRLGPLLVAPDLRDRGLEGVLVAEGVSRAPAGAAAYVVDLAGLDEAQAKPLVRSLRKEGYRPEGRTLRRRR
jgi:tRNA (guanine37-N1)-methyltransferase